METPKKLMVIEDDKFLSGAYKAKLESSGYTVELVTSGENAVERTLAFKPDLIILDIILPVKNGFEVLKEIKENPKIENIPVIIATVLDQSIDIQRALDLGAANYISKTDLTLEKMIELIETYL